MNVDIVPELDIIGQAKKPAALWRPLRRYFRARGFKGLAYFVTNPQAREPVRGFTIVHRGFPSVVSRHYIDEGWAAKNLGPAYVLAQGMPMRWRESSSVLKGDDDFDAFRAAMQEAGLGDGYNLPVYGPRGLNGLLAVGNPVDAAALDNAPVNEMHLIAQAAHMRLCQLLPDLAQPAVLLSARELEILKWVARGKSNGVIAEILDLSAATVDTYLRRIFGKLGVSDRTSASVWDSSPPSRDRNPPHAGLRAALCCASVLTTL